MARKKKTSGFTLVELIVVIGILAVLMAITLVAVNPFEQISKAKDVSTMAVASDFIKTTTQYYVTEKSFPWEKDTPCLNELNAGGTLANMPNCIHDLINDNQLEQKYLTAEEAQQIQVTKCGNSAVLCYSPKTKTVYPESEVKYNKFGVVDPGCPGRGTDCYWCKPVINDAACLVEPSPTPTSAPTATPTLTPTPTPSFPQVLPGYPNVSTKFFKTYAVFFFDYPGFSSTDGSGWNLHLSVNPDFSGDWTQTNKSFGIPSAYGPEGPANSSYTAYRKITMKYVGFASTPSNTGVYSLSNCGKTLYYRIANYYSDTATNKKVGPTYTATFDCTTKVGVVDPPLSWYTVYDQLNNKQKQYDPSWDFDNSGTIDWVDYWLGAFTTKTRSGGWQPPE